MCVGVVVVRVWGWWARWSGGSGGRCGVDGGHYVKGRFVRGAGGVGGGVGGDWWGLVWGVGVWEG